MGQPIPDMPPDLLTFSQSERQGNRSHKRALHPPPLFRSIGLTGLSASLPPHRRLRSVLHRTRAVLPANANETTSSWPQAPCSSSKANISVAPERGLHLKGYIRSNADNSDSYSDSFPDITTQTHHKPDLPQPQPDKELIRMWRENQAGEAKTFRFVSSPSSAQVGKLKHVPTRSNGSLSHKVPMPQRTWHESNSIGPGTPPKAQSRRCTVSSFTQSETHSSETEETTQRLVGKRGGKSRRMKTGVYSQSQASDKDQDDVFCQWLSSLGISDRDQDQAQCLKRSNGADHRLDGAEKGACFSRRDRRPHFLPPISQKDCLLNVPLILPENSPPPSPSCVVSAPFFPLQVPAFPLCTEHRLKQS